jgi:DNA repair protein SbcC/Rad50
VKIHRVEIENLNSLYGRHDIDFDGALADSSVFLIVGPTGSGKTTILDAICLSLFGETPRLVRRRGDFDTDSRQVMSRGTGHCRAAVRFSKRGPDGSRAWFRAEWSCHRSRRSPDGRLQSVQRGLERVDVEGRTLEILVSTSQQRAASAVFEAVLEGLDVADFKRSMVLAQGGFAAFLHASGDERASILERLTDTEIYRVIGARVAEETRQARAAWDACRSHLGLAEGQLLPAEALQQLTERAAALKDAEAGLNLAVQAARAGEAWLGVLERLRARAQTAADRWVLAEAAWAERGEDVQRLAEDRRCRPVALHLRSARRLRAETEQLALQLPVLEAKAAGHEEARARLGEEFARASARRGAADKAYEETRESLVEARRLRQAAALAQTEVEAALEALTRAQHDERGATLSLERAELAVIEATQALDAANAEVGRQSSFEALERELPGVRVRAERLDERRAELHRVRAEAARLDGRSEAAQASHNEAIEALQRAQAEVEGAQARATQAAAVVCGIVGDDSQAAVSARREQLGAEVGDIEAKVEALGDASRHLETLEMVRGRILRRRARIEADSTALAQALTALRDARRAEAASFRDLLVDEDPCPVCGSLDHPSAHVPVPDRGDDETRDRVAALEASLEEQRGHEAEDAGWRAKLEDELQLLVQERAGLTIEWTDAALGESIRRLQKERTQTATALSTLARAAKARAEAGEVLSDARTRHAELAAKREAARERAAESADEAARAHAAQRALANKLAEDAMVLVADLCGLCAIPSPETTTAQIVELLAKAESLVAELVRAREGALGAGRKMDTATASLEQARTVRRAAEKRIRERKREATARRKTLEKLSKDAFVVLMGRDPDVVEAQLRAEINGSAQAERALGTQLEAAAGETAQARTTADERQRLWDRRQVELQEAEIVLAKGLAALAFGSEEDLESALLPEHEESRLALELEPIAEARTSAIALRDGAVTDRDAHLGNRPVDLQDAVDLPTLEELRKQAERACAQHAAEMGRVAAALDEQSRHAERVAQGRAQLDAATAHLTIWQDLHELVGVGDGARFKQFAQSLNLQELVDLANVRLERLAPRYALRVAVDEDGMPTLGFGIHDAHQAGAERPVTTLSGGETFLVSLSLALALADCRSRGMPIETLLLDEGLGTLDQETLGVAMDALERLKGRDTQIGIITHVEGLQQRIPARIQVLPQGGGRSIIDVRVD